MDCISSICLADCCVIAETLNHQEGELEFMLELYRSSSVYLLMFSSGSSALTFKVSFGFSFSDIYQDVLVFVCVQVVKNVASQSFEVKKLVYVYLLHYAEKYASLSNKCLYSFSPFTVVYSSLFSLLS